MARHLRDDLSHLPARKQAELARIKDILFEEFEREIANAQVDWKRNARVFHIILFGSHARDDWVEDHRSGYKSDYDILVVVNHPKLLLPRADCWTLALDRFETDPKVETLVTLITETYSDLNARLRQGHFFFTDIVGDGVALYDTGKPLAEKKENLTAQEKLEIAEEHYREWFPSAREFVMMADFAIGKGLNNKAAFNLHQATESAYSGLLVTLSDYTPNTHNIVHLRSLAELLDERLRSLWPRRTKAERHYYNQLKDAYVKGRYSPHYRITEEELAWIRGKVEALLDLAEEICGAFVEERHGEVESLA